MPLIDICKSCNTKLATEGEYCQFCLPSGLFIEDREVIGDDIGSPVTYIPPHVNGNAGHKDAQQGTISSFNETYIFVRFHAPNDAACKPECLKWK